MSDLFLLSERQMARIERDRTLHSVEPKPKSAIPLRRDTLPQAPQSREPLRKAQGLAAHRNPLSAHTLFSAICIAATVIFRL
ncbi:hypothetical protein GGQ64_004655 [Rhizobium azooxidifex]|uniref:Uncharacterized protein n=1 Tax=Mycoplana azooxidifex TaxID=1636188 RepID=A0A7W6GLN3_9HYPH|nr:hypothetical protein [Mycoplana azooxidifex]